jgi:hypothetical protein
MSLQKFSFLILIHTALISPAFAQDTAKSIALTDKSNVRVLQALQKKKECRNIDVINDRNKSDFTLEAITHKRSDAAWGTDWDVTLFDHEGTMIRSVTMPSLDDAVKTLCRALDTVVVVEVVDPENLMQSVDLRGAGTALPGFINTVTGRRTHTDATSMAVIVKGEHALLDCFEHRKGCVPIGPGKYYGEFDPDKRSIWVNHDIPLTHDHVRDHYVIAGSW